MTSRLATLVDPRTIASDVNPMIVGPQEKGAFAVDLLAVIRESSACWATRHHRWAQR